MQRLAKIERARQRFVGLVWSPRRERAQLRGVRWGEDRRLLAPGDYVFIALQVVADVLPLAGAVADCVHEIKASDACDKFEVVAHPVTIKIHLTGCRRHE